MANSAVTELLAHIQVRTAAEVVFDGLVKAESMSLREHSEVSLIRAAPKEIAGLLYAANRRRSHGEAV